MDKYCKKCGFPYTLWAVLGSYGIVVKCIAAIFFPTEDCDPTAAQVCAFWRFFNFKSLVLICIG